MFAFSDREACLYAGISPATLYNYGADNPGFLERKEQLKLSPNMHAKKAIVEAISKGDLNRAQWWAVHRMGEEFAPKTKTEHSGSIETTGGKEQVHEAAADALRERYEVELRATIVTGGKHRAEGVQEPPKLLLNVGEVALGPKIDRVGGHLTV